MIVFGAIVPHTPLLIPSVGKEHRDTLQKTLKAYEALEQDLYLAKPDTICMIAPHGTRYPDAFSINLSAQYSGGLKSFGDHSTTVKAKSDYLLIDHIQRKIRGAGVPFTLSSNEELEYGFTVPLLLLTEKLESWKLIPVSPSNHDGAAHFEFGRHLKRTLHSDSKRVAVIASCDLSHALSPEAPDGDKPEGHAFDEAVQKAVADYNPQILTKLDPATVQAATQCGYQSMMTMFGTLDGIHVTSKLLSYEAPFGVGYLTAEFVV